MAKKDLLHQLIQALSKNEKRYFKLFAKRHTSDEKKNKHIELFDIIEKQKEYDEDLVKQKLKNSAAIDNFRFNKHYLYNLIVKSLNSYHAEISVDSELKFILHSVEILYKKSLFEQCHQELKKAKELAHKYESLWALLEISRWEFDLGGIQNFLEKEEYKPVNIFKEVETTLDRYKNLLGTQYLSNSFFENIHKKGIVARNEELNSYMDEFMKHPLLQNIDEHKTYRAKIYFYLLHSTYHMRRQEMDKALFYIGKQKELQEANMFLVEDNPRPYITILNNYTSCLIQLKRYNEALETIEKLRNLDVKSTHLKHHIKFWSNNHELEIWFNSKQFEKGYPLALNILEELDNNNYVANAPHHFIMVYFLLSRTFFGMGDYKKTNYCINKIFSFNHDEYRNDIQCFSKIFALITYYEMGKQDLIEYAARSTYRFLSKRNNLYKLENMILQFLKKKAPDMTTPKETVEAFKELQQDIQPLLNDNFEKMAFVYFDFNNWLECKIKGIRYQDYRPEQAQIKS